MEEEEKIEIGKRLKQFATEKFASLAEFGRCFDKDRTFFTPYFNGKSIPGGEILKRLAELGCDINWLLTGASGNMQAKVNALEKENEKLKQEKVTLLDQATVLTKVAEKIKKYGMKN